MSMKPNIWQQQSNEHIKLIKEEHAKEITKLEEKVEEQGKEIDILQVGQEQQSAEIIKWYEESQRLQKQVSEQAKRIQFLEQQLSPLAKKWDDLNNDLIKQLGRKDAKVAKLEEALKEANKVCSETLRYGYTSAPIYALNEKIESLLKP